MQWNDLMKIHAHGASKDLTSEKEQWNGKI